MAGKLRSEGGKTKRKAAPVAKSGAARRKGASARRSGVSTTSKVGAARPKGKASVKPAKGKARVKPAKDRKPQKASKPAAKPRAANPRQSAAKVAATRPETKSTRSHPSRSRKRPKPAGRALKQSPAPVPPPPPVPVPEPPPEVLRPIVPQFVDETPQHDVADFVVYPGVGVCEVTNIESKRFGDLERRFYFLRVLSDRARILLPVANAPRVGLRSIISGKEANAVYSVLKNQVNKRIKDWKKRQALITEKVASGDPLKAAEVYKRLFFLSKTKGLSHGENVAFVKVRTILADELSIISGITKEAMISKIDKILEASYKKRGPMEAEEEEV